MKKQMYVSWGTLQKSKGFTLIELLAVIVILAIIALIATPIVLNIIKDSKQSSTLRSANFYLDAVEQAIARENDTTGKLKNTKCFIEEKGILSCQGYEKELEIEINGEKPSSGKVVIKDNKIDEIELYYEDKLVVKDDDKKLVYSEEIYENVKDSNPGIICGESSKEDLTQETCYIKSIEDLVELSTLVNKGTAFENKKVELVYNLDFESMRSYASKKINKSLITGEGFTPIGYSTTRTFKGVFEGNNNTIKGLYINRPETSYIGLFGYVEGISISNLKFKEVNLIGKSSIGTVIGTNKSAIVENITLRNIKLKSKGGEYDNVGGLIGSNYSLKINNIKSINIEIDGGGYAGGLIGVNSGQLVQNINFNDIKVKGTIAYAGGLTAVNSTGVIQNIVGDNIVVIAERRRTGGLVGTNRGSIKKIELKNIQINGSEWVGGLVGSHEAGSITNIKLTNVNINGITNIGGIVGLNYALVENSVFSGNVKGSISVSLGVGSNSKGQIKNIIVKGKSEGYNDVGGLIGSTSGTSAENPANISGVYLSGTVSNTSGSAYRMVGYSKNTTLNTLASSQILVNGNIVVSDDPTNVNGKSLDDMGKASQSEYEAIGFEFESTEENEAYWYFDENDELDLIIKKAD